MSDKPTSSSSIRESRVDLRWGITEEEKAEGKVLPICLAEIQRTRPYFIGVLGERYGWVPGKIDEELLDIQPCLKKIKNMEYFYRFLELNQRI